MHACHHGSANASTSSCASAPVPLQAPPSPLPDPFVLASRSSSPQTLIPVTVPPGCYPIELVQFWRDEHERGHPHPLHWALFVRTTDRLDSHPNLNPNPNPNPHPNPHPHPHPPTYAKARSKLTTCKTRLKSSGSTCAWGNFYELVGSQTTYTAQILHRVAFEPERVPDWRGTHVIGWVSPGQLAMFEGVVRQVQVWRHRLDWQSQHWVYDVVSAVGGNDQGLFVDQVTFAGLQRRMDRLLDAWENGDI